MMDVNIGSSHGAFCLMRSLGTPPVFGRPFPSLESFSSPFKKKKYQKFSHRNGSIFPEASGREEKEHSSSRLFLFFSFLWFLLYIQFSTNVPSKRALYFYSLFPLPPPLFGSLHLHTESKPFLSISRFGKKENPQRKESPLLDRFFPPAGDSSAAKKKKRKEQQQQQQ